MQYFIRPVSDFSDFAAQVSALLGTAADYHAQLVVFPEYFSAQLLTLGDVSRPIAHQVRDLANNLDDFISLFQTLAKKYGVYIVAGTIPTLDAIDPDTTYNVSYFFGPSGDFASQGKIHMTRFEREEWLISPQNTLRIFDTALGKIAITICYDVEFPELARAAARAGATILVVPSCTDDRQGFLRVRYCAHARAIENQMYVVHASTVGSLPMVPAVSLNYGQAAILTPSDFSFARDGILAEGSPNQETVVFGDLDLERLLISRERGSVLPLRDSETTASVIKNLEHSTL